MKLKLVIFDVDGTILDTEARWQEAWKIVGEKYNIESFHTKTFLKCVGQTGKIVENIVKKDLNNYENPLRFLEEARECGKKLLEERIDVKPGVFVLLDKLKSMSIKIAVATTTNRELTIKRLDKAGLIDYFDYILCGDQVHNRKPDPEIYNKVVEYFHIKVEEALVLEDSIVGVEAAYNAHIPCIMIPDLIPASVKQEKETVAILESLNEVIKFIDRI